MKKEYVFRIVLVLCIAILVYVFGIKPIFIKGAISSSPKKDNWASGLLQEEKDVYDVVVVGDEPDGISAAVAASRSGAKTLLISDSSDMGGIITKGLYPKLETAFGYRGESISKGFFSELYKALGDEFTIGKYRMTINSILKKEKNLELVPDAKDISPVMKENTVVGIKASVSGQEKLFAGKRFIDSTREGLILSACNVPYIAGAADLNLKETFEPARLNFELEGVSYKDIRAVIDLYKDKFYKKINEYKTYHLNMAVRNFKVYDNGQGNVIIQGLEIEGVNVTEKNSLKSAYIDAVDEAKNFAAFLTNHIEVFSKAKFVKAADKLVMTEVNHYSGEQTLSVVELMENKDFEDKIALGAHPVESFIDDQKRYILGKPVQYGIPLGCIIPAKVENLMMTGGKVSYSSLAATSADKNSVNITVGQSAGIIAVYSITREMSPRQLVKEKDENTLKDIEKLLKKQGVYLPDFKIENKNAQVWCYDSLKKLISLGLVAGGMENNFKFDAPARERDMGYILLNGVYRLSPDKYSYNFDASLRPYLNDKKLSKEKVGEILLLLHGVEPGQKDRYLNACKKQYIDELAQLRLKDKEFLTMDDVYYLGAYNIRLYTGKNITY